MGKLKILLICEQPLPSSRRAGRPNFTLAELSKLGHDVTALCPRPSSAELTDGTNAEFWYLPIEFNQFSLLGRIRLNRMMAKALAEHSIRSFDILRTVNLLPTKTALEIPGRTVPVYAELTDFASDLYRNFGLPLSGLVTRYLERVQRAVAKNIDVCSVESSIGREHWAEYGLERSKVAVIPNGVDTKHFSPFDSHNRTLARELGTDGYTTLFTHGDFGRSEGIAALVFALALLGKEYRLLLCGAGPKNYLASLLATASKLGVRDQVVYPGWVDYSILPSYMALADVAVSPFLADSWQAKSNLHTKIREYLSMQLRFAVTSTPALREMVGDIPYYIDDPSNPRDVAGAIGQALADAKFENKKRKMEAIASVLDWPNIIRRDELLMNDIADGNFRHGSDYDIHLQ